MNKTLRTLFAINMRSMVDRLPGIAADAFVRFIMSILGFSIGMAAMAYRDIAFEEPTALIGIFLGMYLTGLTLACIVDLARLRDEDFKQ